uniref:CDC42 effector protein (Rho GTPase binding) 5 n=1 Tax=Takifugu rubripes TaxID=31033 RepID=A0A674PIC4_TAKRU
MPLHKSNRASRLDPTMISAPLGDFRHTMHVGRGGDAFGDTSFLLTLGPNQASLYTDGPGSPENHELQHSESVSSFTLDLELDLGPSMLGDVLGVMDGMGLEEDSEHRTIINSKFYIRVLKPHASPELTSVHNTTGNAYNRSEICKNRQRKG